MQNVSIQEFFNAFSGFLKPLNKVELCSFLNIEKHTLEYYNGRGLPRFKVGNETRYHIPDVLDFFRQRGVELNPKENFGYET